MRPAGPPAAPNSPWGGPGGTVRPFTLRRLLLALIVPPRGHRTIPTAAGAVLVCLAFALGLAAYNTSSNILFIALSLLLSSLILSGLLAWFNVRRVRWRLVPRLPFRAGEEAVALLEVENPKKILPTYSLVFEVRARTAAAKAELRLRDRLEPLGSIELPFRFTPARRGPEEVELLRVRSQYPFGFLNKGLPGDQRIEVRVWPARLPYQRHPAGALLRLETGQPSRRTGSGGDLVGLRPYRPGDPFRLIHWKASARVRRLVTRQHAAETQTAIVLHLEPGDGRWQPGEQFERLCSLAATLAEDLFTEGRLIGVAIDDRPQLPIRRLSDLESFLDQLATLTPGPTPTQPALRGRAQRHAVLTFEPSAPRGVHALIDGSLAATA